MLRLRCIVAAHTISSQVSHEVPLRAPEYYRLGRTQRVATAHTAHTSHYLPQRAFPNAPCALAFFLQDAAF
eukprot:1549617-Pleurochrysis_carterae.AAC.1